MNIQHSSRTDNWGTPLDIIERVRLVMPTIHLDPASSAYWNLNVKAENIYTEGSLTKYWYGSMFINPPGGKIGNESNTALFWQKLMGSIGCGVIDEAIFLAFSLEALQTTQNKGVRSIGDFPFCVPARRIKFLDATGERSQPSHSNVICYVPGLIDNTKLFIEAFRDLGVLVNV